MENQNTASLIFICHSSEDEVFTVEELVKQLKVLQTKFEVFVSEKLGPGTQWHEEIISAIEAATAAILVVSPDSLTSDYILQNEVPLLQRREREGLRIIPLIWKPCAWEELDWLSKSNARPRGGKPELVLREKNDRALVLKELTVELSKLIGGESAQSKPKAPPGRRRPDRAVQPTPGRVPRRSSLLLGRGSKCPSRNLRRRRAVSLSAVAPPASDRFNAPIRQRGPRSSKLEAEGTSEADA